MDQTTTAYGVFWWSPCIPGTELSSALSLFLFCSLSLFLFCSLSPLLLPFSRCLPFLSQWFLFWRRMLPWKKVLRKRKRRHKWIFLFVVLFPRKQRTRFKRVPKINLHQVTSSSIMIQQQSFTFFSILFRCSWFTYSNCPLLATFFTVWIFTLPWYTLWYTCWDNRSYVQTLDDCDLFSFKTRDDEKYLKCYCY